MLSKLDTRTVLRVTLIRNYNNNADMIPAFAKMLDQSNVHFVEIKSYMHIGRSTNRLEYDDMLQMEEVQDFAHDLIEKNPNFTVMDESEISRIVVLQNKKRFIDRFIPTYSETK
jgi:tRNA wybutosine-synthesizing protein 1